MSVTKSIIRTFILLTALLGVQAFAQQAPVGRQWTIPLTFTPNNPNANTFHLEFGTNPNATAGFDSGIDEIVPPPGFTYYVYFTAPPPTNFLRKDYRSTESASEQWIAVLSNTITNNITTTITWDPSQFPPGDIAGTLTINGQNMLTTDTLVVNPFTTAVVIQYTSPVVNAPTADFSGSPLSGPAPLSVTFTPAITGSAVIDSFSWSFPGGSPETVSGAGMPAPVNVVYNTAGTFDVSLTVTNNAGTDTETKLDYINVMIDQPDIDGPAETNIGDVTVGACGDGTVTISNLGTADLTVNSTALSGAHSDQFAVVSGGAPFTIAPGGTHDIGVRFCPTTAGAKTAALQIESNDPDENPFEVALTGNGVPPVQSTTVILPAVMGSRSDLVSIPISVSSDSAFGFAQFVIDYDSTVVKFVNASTGSATAGFSLLVQANLPFAPSAPGTNENVLVQVSSGSNSFTGENQEVVLLAMMVKDDAGEGAVSPLVFDPDPAHTSLTTVNGVDINNGALEFIDGQLTVVVNRFSVSGTVSYCQTLQPISGTDMAITHSEGMTNVTTDASGAYAGTNILGGAVSITPSKESDLRNAIAGSDALKCLRALAFLENLTACQERAADVNLSGSVTGSDALAILRYLAFFTSGIASVGEWRFFPGDTSFVLSQNATVDFSAVLLGDVNLSWPPSGGVVATASTSPSPATVSAAGKLVLGQRGFAPGDAIAIPLSLTEVGEAVNTVIFTVEYDPDHLKYRTIEKTALSESFLMAANAEMAGKIHVAMASVNGLASEGDLLRLEFEPLPVQNSVNTSSQLHLTRVQINDVEMAGAVLSLTSNDESNLPKDFSLSQNHPNPFNPETRISYTIPAGTSGTMHVTLRIYDMQGHLVRTLVDDTKSPGQHTVVWDGRNAASTRVTSGLYFYTMTAGSFSATKKMLILK
ncbi:MAG: hypothetical protein DKINENOH_03958 [bacterium]|nr:hypothetical protein [bacterium]